MVHQILLVDISVKAIVTFVWPRLLFCLGKNPAVKAEGALDKLSDGLEGFSCQQETLNSGHKKPFPADAFWNVH